MVETIVDECVPPQTLVGEKRCLDCLLTLVRVFALIVRVGVLLFLVIVSLTPLSRLC